MIQVSAYYRWPILVVLPYFNLKNQPDNYRLISAIRVFRRGRTTGREQVLVLVPKRWLRYASLSGLPVRDYGCVLRAVPVHVQQPDLGLAVAIPAQHHLGRFLGHGLAPSIGGVPER